LCTTAAPAAMQARASAAISAGSMGTFGLCCFDFTPLTATSMITGPWLSCPLFVTAGS
jgi:hypothetical protein